MVKKVNNITVYTMLIIIQDVVEANELKVELDKVKEQLAKFTESPSIEILTVSLK